LVVNRPPPDPPAAPLAAEHDPDVLARWLTITSLIEHAHDMLQREGGAWSRSALATVDTAVEATLGLVASTGSRTLKRDAGYDDALAAAVEALTEHDRQMPADLRRRLHESHRLRNAAVHHGSEPAARAVGRAIEAARALRDLAISGSPLLEAFREAGPVTAVAGLVGVPVIAGPLHSAEELLRAGDLTGATDQAAIALDRALALVDPPLRGRHRFSRHRLTRYRYTFSGDPVAKGLSDVIEALEELDREGSDRADRQEAWLMAFGLGLQPGELYRLRRTLGEPVYLQSGADVHRAKDVELTAPVVEAALLRVSDIVFRLWQNETLRDSRAG
jgi:hypothetical protein